MVYDPQTLRVLTYRWFGDPPGNPLPYIGNRIARHSKGNAQGVKLERAGHRDVGQAEFEDLTAIDQLADHLFGPRRSHGTSLVLAQHRQRFGSEWLMRVRSLVGSPRWDESIELAHVVDGYAVLE